MEDGPHHKRGLISRLMALFRLRNSARASSDLERDFRTLINEGEEQGLLDESEGEMLESIFEFKDTVAREVMVPRTSCIVLPLSTPVDEIIETIIQKGHTRIPIYVDDVDHVEGILHAKDLLKFWGRDVGQEELKSILRRPGFAPETKLIGDLLADMKRRKEHLAVVIDEYGGTSGLITIEDILEEIVGEISDEHDRDEPMVTELEDGSIEVNPRLGAEELADRFGLELPEGDFESVGGLLIHLTGRVPETDERIDFGPLRFTIKMADERRIHKVLISRISSEETNITN